MDADLSHSPKDIKKKLNIIMSGKYNLIIFSKYLKKSKHFSRDKDRVLISFVVSKICNMHFIQNE